MATVREKIEGHSVSLLIHLLGMRRFAKFVISQGLKRVPKERAEWVVNLIASQNPKLMITAWREVMKFDSRNRLSEIKCPTLIVAGANDEAVPMHHSKMLHDGVVGSELVVINNADHALIWAQPDELTRAVDTFLEA